MAFHSPADRNNVLQLLCLSPRGLNGLGQGLTCTRCRSPPSFFLSRCPVIHGPCATRGGLYSYSSSMKHVPAVCLLFASSNPCAGSSRKIPIMEVEAHIRRLLPAPNMAPPLSTKGIKSSPSDFLRDMQIDCWRQIVYTASKE